RRRRRHRVAGEVVFEREQRVEAQGLGEIADRQMLADDGCVRAPGLAQHVERGPDLHGAFSGCIIAGTIRRSRYQVNRAGMPPPLSPPLVWMGPSMHIRAECGCGGMADA